MCLKIIGNTLKQLDLTKRNLILVPALVKAIQQLQTKVRPFFPNFIGATRPDTVAIKEST